MFNTSSNTVTTLLPYIGDATGIASVTGFHKIYTAEVGSVHLLHRGWHVDRQSVRHGDRHCLRRAYMDGLSDANKPSTDPMLADFHSDAECPILAAFLFLRPGWETTSWAPSFASFAKGGKP